MENSGPGKAKVPEPNQAGSGQLPGSLVRDTGKFQVRRRGPGSVRDPEWMQVNQKAYCEAEKNRQCANGLTDDQG